MTLAVRAVFWVVAYVVGYAGLAFILVHFAISAHWGEVTPAKAVAAPLLVWFGMAALAALRGADRQLGCGCPMRRGI